MPENNISKLLDIMARLRDPTDGCPWDVEQNFASIAPYTIEEAYEVADAIDRGDLQALRGELGDLLLQVVFHAQMAAEQGAFHFGDVVTAISEKMIRRHPHVFADAAAGSAVEQRAAWERHKSEERAGEGEDGALAGVALALPALLRAAKLGKRAAAVGFDWPDAAGVVTKVHEELTELEQAREAGETSRVREELGDLLFATANLARHLGVDPEEALRAANRKFARRFGRMESELAARDETWATLTPQAMDMLWNEAKKSLDKK